MKIPARGKKSILLKPKQSRGDSLGISQAEIIGGKKLSFLASLGRKIAPKKWRRCASYDCEKYLPAFSRFKKMYCNINCKKRMRRHLEGKQPKPFRAGTSYEN